MLRLFGLLPVGVVACAAMLNTGELALAKNWNNSGSKRDEVANIFIPKYFFSDSINKSCLMEGRHEHRSFGKLRTPLSLDLTQKENFQWMDKLKFYNWKGDHDKRSDSLDVYMEQLTNRMNFCNATLDNAIITDTLYAQAKLTIKLLVAFAENNLMLDSTSIPKILAMKQKGDFNRCYKGKGDTKAVCHGHPAQEASRFAGQITIAALKVQPFMDEPSSKVIGNYLKKLYKKFS